MRATNNHPGSAPSLNQLLSEVLKETSPSVPEHSAPDDLMTAFQQGMFWEHEILEMVDGNFAVLAKKSPEAAIRLVDKFGGSRLWIPALLPEVNHLQIALGNANARIVFELYQNSFLVVPKLWPLRREIYRRRAVVTLREEGWTRGQLSHAFRISRRHVNRILHHWKSRLVLNARMNQTAVWACGESGNTLHP